MLDGQAVRFDQLEEALEAAKRDDSVVWYYRESASQTPPPRALEVLNLVVQNQLRVSLSSRPDFSDYIDAEGVSHPRTPAAAPGQQAQPRVAATAIATAEDGLAIPEVDLTVDVEDSFTRARKTAAGDRKRTALVIVRPNREHLVMPAMAETPALKHAMQALQRLVPSNAKRTIAVIAYTVFPGNGEPGVNDVNRSIPFIGMLMGFTYIGHAVVVFEGNSSALRAGCRNADVLIVDSAMMPLLEEGWQDTASSVMRNANILVHDRDTFQLRILRKYGEQMGALGFVS